MCGMELLIHSETSTVEPLNFLFNQHPVNLNTWISKYTPDIKYGDQEIIDTLQTLRVQHG